MRIPIGITACLSLVLYVQPSVLAFSIQQAVRIRGIHQDSFRSSGAPLCAAAQNEADEEQDWKDYNPMRDEQSQLPDYVASFLDRERDDEEEKDEQDCYTHLIAVPMDDCHQLLLELESVQRGILYHCPMLVHACIVPAMTRLPLLYVTATDKTVATVTRTLHDLVERVVKEQFFVKKPVVAIQDPENEDEVFGTVNSDGFQPLILSFQNLEIDGQGNDVLHSVGLDAPGSTQLTDLVNTLKTEIEALGWKVSLPPDDNTAAAGHFRPRVPFMRLPPDFSSLLDPLEGGQEEWMRTSDQGGNGISPIFWYQWSEDEMARNVRLREISVYPRQPGKLGVGEQAFYIPHETTMLPSGNEALTKDEARHRSYHEKRIAEAEGRIVEDDDTSSEVDIKNPEIEKERQRLETAYAAPDDAIDANSIDDDVKKEIEQSLEAIDGPQAKEKETNESLNTKSSDNKVEEPSSQLDEWTKNRIRSTVEGLASIQARKVKEKEKPTIEDNPVFRKYKKGTLVDKKDPASVETTKQLPPYPSREHFFGIWRVVTSPTGFSEEVGDDTKSDNLILRVDGTIAGGPTLDRKTNQKASGGTWKMLDATDDDGTRLRIRMVIPPKKERILVMEGEVTRFMSGTEMPMTKGTFGIPELEAAAQEGEEDMEDLMHCGGGVWIEDAVTGKNREEIGTFSLMKIQSPLDPSKYTITIPRPVRSQD